MVLALVQSKRTLFRPEKEVTSSFTAALANADKMLSNVPSTMKYLEDAHSFQPINHNIVRHGRRR